TGSATPSFVDCKIHDNTKYALVYVGETANPSLKNCEVYNGGNFGIAVEYQARGTYTKCYIHNNKGGNFSIKTSKTIDTSTCRME
ncbi:MAG: right-handed parallel beta-helix repeat-containing protein, partial [Spirochaetaceae bacterium]|nr:right-handed parallel beta-helix repeat-containing protein [Spirochaetaceae bacterium]